MKKKYKENREVFHTFSRARPQLVLYKTKSQFASLLSHRHDRHWGFVTTLPVLHFQQGASNSSAASLSSNIFEAACAAPSKNFLLVNFLLIFGISGIDSPPSFALATIFFVYSLMSCRKSSLSSLSVMISCILFSHSLVDCTLANAELDSSPTSAFPLDVAFNFFPSLST